MVRRAPVGRREGGSARLVGTRCRGGRGGVGVLFAGVAEGGGGIGERVAAYLIGGRFNPSRVKRGSRRDSAEADRRRASERHGEGEAASVGGDECGGVCRRCSRRVWVCRWAVGRWQLSSAPDALLVFRNAGRALGKAQGDAGDNNGGAAVARQQAGAERASGGAGGDEYAEESKRGAVERRGGVVGGGRGGGGGGSRRCSAKSSERGLRACVRGAACWCWCCCCCCPGGGRAPGCRQAEHGLARGLHLRLARRRRRRCAMPPC